MERIDLHNDDEGEVLRSAARELLTEMHSLGFIPELTDQTVEEIMPSLGSLRSMPLDFRRKMAPVFAKTLCKRGETEESQAYLSDHIHTAVMRSLNIPSETPDTFKK